MSKKDTSNAYIRHLVDKVLSQVRLSPHEHPQNIALCTLSAEVTSQKAKVLSPTCSRIVDS